MTRPAGNDDSMKVKITGIQVKMTCWVGSAGVGLSRIWTNMVTPMISGQMPSTRNDPKNGTVCGSQGIRPKRVKMLLGSGAERSLIQPKNGAWRISMVMNSTL